MVLGRPPVDHLRLAPRVRDVAATPQQIGQDQPGPLLQMRKTELLSGRDRLLGVGLEVAVAEPRAVLQRGDGDRQPGCPGVLADGRGCRGATVRTGVGGAGHTTLVGVLAAKLEDLRWVISPAPARSPSPCRPVAPSTTVTGSTTHR